MIKAICDCGHVDYIGDFITSYVIKANLVTIYLECSKCKSKLRLELKVKRGIQGKTLVIEGHN